MNYIATLTVFFAIMLFILYVQQIHYETRLEKLQLKYEKAEYELFLVKEQLRFKHLKDQYLNKL